MASEGEPVFDEQLLDDLRKKIDDVDQRLITLINERANLVVDVGKIKREYGLPIYTPHREAAVLKKISGLIKGRFHSKPLKPFIAN